MIRLLRKYIIPVIAAILTWTASNTHWTGDNWKHTLLSDAQGYYAYLPAVFIYHDPNMGSCDSVESKYFKDLKYNFFVEQNGKHIDKYYCGTAVCIAPFFLVAHGITLLSSEPADGYSYYYIVFAQIATVSWLLIGLIFLRKVLRMFSVSEGYSAFILFAIVLGTNIFYYVISEPCMSHIFSFSFVCMFLYGIRRAMLAPSGKHILLSAAALAMILLIRPVNGLIIFSIPFLAGSTQALKMFFRNAFTNKLTLLAAMLLFVLICSIQLVMYKISSGRFFTDTYSSEHFNFGEPHFADILFSYKKGLFLYTPLTFVAIAGFIHLWRTNLFRFFALLGFLVLIVCVLSSWWMWYYGGSFSGRVFIEYFPFFALLMGFTFSSFQNKLPVILYSTLVGLLILVCQVQTYQYRYHVIHWSEMNKERYWKVFLRIDYVIKGENPNGNLLR